MSEIKMKERVGGLGTEVLKDNRMEQWCQGVSIGEDETECWQRCFRLDLGREAASKSTVKSAKWQLKQRPEVQARLRFLRAENAKRAKISKEDKLKITEEVIQGLRADFHSGERGKVVSDLMMALQRHDQMTGEGDKPSLEINFNFNALFAGLNSVVKARLDSEGVNLPSCVKEALTGANVGLPVGSGGVVEEESEG